ncbi:MaoC family dehydratase N-terminal domain-containing protein [Alcaligenaceae bacterium]|nr:MaoC family dehydratase N-terminal domain-containing protein [Alcaligenaceae bacterium]
MAINYEQLKNWRFEERTDHYGVRDSIIYALTLGYGDDPSDIDDLRYVYEHDTLAVPTLLATVGAPGAWATNPELGIDWVKLLHGEHRITFHAPVPAEASVISRTRVTHVVDKGAGKGALVVTTRDIFNAEGLTPLATVEHVSFLRADGGFGQGDEPLPALPATPAAAPEATLMVRSTPQSAALYRLNGDLNPIHILPGMAAKAGFDRPILHGLCTYGMAARALVKHYCPVNPERLRSFSVRFSSPVFPGETLRVEAWKTGGQVQFRALAHERNVVVLSHGVAGIGEAA